MIVKLRLTTMLVVALVIAGAAWWLLSTSSPDIGPAVLKPQKASTSVQVSSEEPLLVVGLTAEAEPVERIPAEPSDAKFAPTAPVPTATLRGVLAESISKHVGTHGGLHEKPSANTYLSSRGYNPDSKVLSPEQLVELDQLIDEYEPLLTELHEQDGNLTREALLIGLERDQRLSQDLNEGLQSTDQAIMNRHRIDLSRTATKRSMETLTQHFGKPLEDWAWSQISTHAPDGVPRSSVVYFLRGDAPGVFAARDRIGQTWSERDQRIIDFFARQ
jgi:hypothetical protein